MDLRTVTAGVLEVSYAEVGPPDGWPCVLSHGFPYDIHAYTDAASILAGAGARVLIPYLRGYGPTRFLSDTTPRSGEQAALGADLLAFMDALGVERAVLGGYDWGGRASCIVAALWPDRVTALVSGNSYNIQNIAQCNKPAPAEVEAGFWYQYYFHGERGRRGLEENRDDIARTLWRMWSPEWDFSEATFRQSAPAFANPDFVEVVIHSYRHRFGLVPGDPAVAHIETQLTAQPPITVPAVCVDGAADRVDMQSTAHHGARFTGPYQYLSWEGAGHNLPQERPQLWADAILAARGMAG